MLCRHGAVEVLSEHMPSPRKAPRRPCSKRSGRLRCAAALRRLPPKDRMLFYRKYYYLQPTAQIAAELGLTERAVEGRLYRLKKQLRKMLGGDAHA